jgi:hypothetical protein
MKAEIIDKSEAPEYEIFPNMNAKSLERRKFADALIKDLQANPDKVAEVYLDYGAGETDRGTKVLLTKNARRLGTAVDTWKVGEIMYVRLRKDS